MHNILTAVPHQMYSVCCCPSLVCPAVESTFSNCDSHLELASTHDAEWDDSGCTASLAFIKEGLLLTANAGGWRVVGAGGVGGWVLARAGWEG